MPLILPKSLARPKPPPVQIGVYLTSEQLGGLPVTMADLVAGLAKLKRSEVIRSIVAISSRLADPLGQNNHLLQWALANELLPPDALTALKQLDRSMESAWAIFHRRQLSFLLQVAVGTCQEATDALDSRTMAHAVGRLCLMANTLLHAHEPVLSTDQWNQNYNFCFVPSVIRVLDHKPSMEILARAYMLWFELPKLPVIAKHFRSRRIAAFGTAFAEKYGLSLERFFLVTASLWAHYYSEASGKAAATLVEPRQYLIPHFGAGDVSRAMQLLAETPDTLAQKVATKPADRWIDDASLLMAHPILEVFPGKYACPDIVNLYRFLTERIYFLLKDAYHGNAFQELFGYVFEEYVGSFIGHFGIENDTFRTYWRSPKFVGSTAEACDGLLCNGEIALVMENKARLLLLQEKYGGNPEITWRGVQDIVGKPGSESADPKGVYQLARSIARMLKGETIHSGPSSLNLKTAKKVIPALVAYEDAVSLGAVRKWANARLRDGLEEHGIDPARVSQLLILNTHDIERLEALTHKTSWAEMISDYADYAKAHGDDPIATFDVFSFRHNLPSEDPGTSFLAEQFDKAMAFLRDAVDSASCALHSGVEE